MTSDELREEIEIELESMAEMVRESVQLCRDVGDGTPTMREKTAAGGFLAHFYNGVENILRRISRFYAVPLPEGGNWHVRLFRQFCEPDGHLPLLFDETLAAKIGPFRSFRHMFFHTYGFQLDWQRMRTGIGQIEDIFWDFRNVVLLFLESLNQGQD